MIPSTTTLPKTNIIKPSKTLPPKRKQTSKENKKTSAVKKVRSTDTCSIAATAATTGLPKTYDDIDHYDPELPPSYTLLDFREDLVRDILDLDMYAEAPVYRPQGRPTNHNQFKSDHLPKFSAEKRNCKLCYSTTKKGLEVYSHCDNEHCMKEKNCFEIWHTQKSRE